jgi:hypothetical protein
LLDSVKATPNEQESIIDTNNIPTLEYAEEVGGIVNSGPPYIERIEKKLTDKLSEFKSNTNSNFNHSMKSEI